MTLVVLLNIFHLRKYHKYELDDVFNLLNVIIKIFLADCCYIKLQISFENRNLILF